MKKITAPKAWLILFVLICWSPAWAQQACQESIVATTPETAFLPHSNGTVTDKTTSLMWMRCSLGQKWDGETCRNEGDAFSWAEALKASVLHDFAGYGDWRLPNKNELASLIEERCVSPAINADVFPNTPAGYYWTSSPYAGVEGGAWSVDFSYGYINASVKRAGLHVRLVRDGM